jgi:hypothetical protein
VALILGPKEERPMWATGLRVALFVVDAFVVLTAVGGGIALPGARPVGPVLLGERQTPVTTTTTAIAIASCGMPAEGPQQADALRRAAGQV